MAFVFADRDLHDDALPCLAALRERGLRLGAAGNMHAHHEEFLRPHVDFVGSSERWGVEKPDAGFFERVVAASEAPAAEILYVGDRVDNDVVPARAAGAPRPFASAVVPTPTSSRPEDGCDRLSLELPAVLEPCAGVPRRDGSFDAHALEDGVPLVLGRRRDRASARARRPLGRRRARRTRLTDGAARSRRARGHRRALPRPPEPRRRRLARPARAGAGERIRARGWKLANADVVLIGEEPRLAPHRDEMRRAATAQALGVDPELVAVRATTTDGLGFTGRREGLAAQAVALLVR